MASPRRAGVDRQQHGRTRWSSKLFGLALRFSSTRLIASSIDAVEPGWILSSPCDLRAQAMSSSEPPVAGSSSRASRGSAWGAGPCPGPCRTRRPAGARPGRRAGPPGPPGTARRPSSRRRSGRSTVPAPGPPGPRAGPCGPPRPRLSPGRAAWPGPGTRRTPPRLPGRRAQVHGPPELPPRLLGPAGGQQDLAQGDVVERVGRIARHGLPGDGHGPVEFALADRAEGRGKLQVFQLQAMGRQGRHQGVDLVVPAELVEQARPAAGPRRAGRRRA